jgi:hypothetical protein
MLLNLYRISILDKSSARKMIGFHASRSETQTIPTWEDIVINGVKKESEFHAHEWLDVHHLVDSEFMPVSASSNSSTWSMSGRSSIRERLFCDNHPGYSHSVEERFTLTSAAFFRVHPLTHNGICGEGRPHTITFRHILHSID